MSSKTRRRNTKRKSWGIAALVACLLLVAIGGTIAWLTAQDSLTNEFNVGKFNDPTTEPDPTDPSNPDPLPEDPTKLNGHLYEPNWDAENNKIVPGITLEKDPYVGIGKDSESAYVYIYVRNSASTPSNIYFKLNNGWTAVNGQATTVDDVGTADPGYEQGGTYYCSGLFKYAAGLTGSTTGDVWTTDPAFSEIYVKNSATAEGLAPEENSDITALKVTALLHQKTSGSGTDIAETEADTWATTQASTLATENLTSTPAP